MARRRVLPGVRRVRGDRSDRYVILYVCVRDVKHLFQTFVSNACFKRLFEWTQFVYMHVHSACGHLAKWPNV